MPQIHFFATRNDQIALLNAAERLRPFKYVLMGMFDSPEPQSYTPGSAIPTLGRTETEAAIGGPIYLVVEISEKVTVEPIPQRSGGIKYEIGDQTLNPNSMTIWHGGFYDNVLLYGKIATVSTTPGSKDIYKQFKSALGKLFTKVDIYYVGPEALKFGKSGGRLAEARQTPLKYDLKLE